MFRLRAASVVTQPCRKPAEGKWLLKVLPTYTRHTRQASQACCTIVQICQACIEYLKLYCANPSARHLPTVQRTTIQPTQLPVIVGAYPLRPKMVMALPNNCLWSSTTQQPALTQLSSVPVRPKRNRRAAQTHALAAGFVVGGSASSLQGLYQLASLAGLAIVGAYWLSAELREQERVSDQNSRECPTCEGTGYQDCFCSRWSDNDVGCSSCSGSGKMICRSCGGGGRAVPVTQKLYNRRKL